MLQIHNLTKTFKKKIAINNFTYAFNEGVYVILGPNGSGKTTLLRCIANIYPLSNNTITFEGKCIKRNKTYPLNLGYLSQNFGTFKDLTVKEAMQFFSSLKVIDENKMQNEIINSIELVNLSERLDNKVYSLSGGMVRRLGIAQAILGNPSIILLDEPTIGLDPEEIMRFKNLISEIKKNKIIIISTHDIEIAESISNNILVINGGELVFSGTQKDISDIAKDKVYEINAKDKTKVRGDYLIEKTYTFNNQNFLRIICDEPQKFISTTPTLEDGYLCLTNKI